MAQRATFQRALPTDSSALNLSHHRVEQRYFQKQTVARTLWSLTAITDPCQAAARVVAELPGRISLGSVRRCRRSSGSQLKGSSCHDCLVAGCTALTAAAGTVTRTLRQDLILRRFSSAPTYQTLKPHASPTRAEATPASNHMCVSGFEDNEPFNGAETNIDTYDACLGSSCYERLTLRQTILRLRAMATEEARRLHTASTSMSSYILAADVQEFYMPNDSYIDAVRPSVYAHRNL